MAVHHTYLGQNVQHYRTYSCVYNITVFLGTNSVAPMLSTFLFIFPDFHCTVLLSATLSANLRGPLVTHHGGELLVADLAVPVQVGLPDHLVDLLLAEVLAQGAHDLAELLCADVSVAVAVEHAEGLADVVGALVLLDLLGHHRQELLELDAPVAVNVHLRKKSSLIGK